MKTLDRYEYLKLLNELDYRHGSFYHLWEMGKPRFVQGREAEVIQTGAVSFNKDGKFLEFLINEGFWNTLNFQQKAFLIAHECLHVTYNHGYRLFRHAKNQNDALLMNWACDIVINHRLIELGFDRAVIDPENKFCWIDTVFRDRASEIEPNRSSEYYYSRLKEMQDEVIEQLKDMLETVDQHASGGGGSGEEEGEEGEDQQDGQGSGQGEEQEDVDTGGFEDMTDILEELADRMDGNEMNDVAKDFEKRHKDLDEKINEEQGNGNPNSDSIEAGDSPGSILKRVDPKLKVKPKPKWETVIKKWVKKTRLDEFRTEEQWARTARRFQLLRDSDLILPSEMETDEPLIEKHKVGIYFFLDTSGSCSGYADRFWRAAKSIPKEFFDVRMFCFDTRVYETTLESGKLYGFGGTSFSPIESHIQKIMSREEVRYPDAVFLITDGYGDNVHPQHPDRWHWFMTENYSISCVPSGSKVHKLSEFE